MMDVRTRVLVGFDDPAFGPDGWDALLAESGCDNIYLTWQYQRTWWETFQRGQLLLVVAERGGRPVALAPLYAQSKMVYFIGSEFESDYLDFIGDVSDAGVLDALLQTARENVPDFLGFHFYFVPDKSDTGKRLAEAAGRLGLRCYETEDMIAPVLDIAAQPEVAVATANKRRLVKLERFFERDGTLAVHHLRSAEEIIPNLRPFFEQHISRWADAPGNPSRFLYEKVPVLIERFTRVAGPRGMLRFTRIEWHGRPIAFHYGYCYRGRYFWGIPSFAKDLARHSPGQVLLGHVLRAAIEEGARLFDFGTGDHAFKLRFATHTQHVRTWELYPTGEGRRADGSRSA